MRRARPGSCRLSLGCTQIYDKYCSTLDSTAEGNISRITDELTELTGATRAIVVPSFPDTGRTVYQGYHFVFDRLLSESGMRDHPLKIHRGIRCARPPPAGPTEHPVTNISLATVREGPAALRDALTSASGTPITSSSMR